MVLTAFKRPERLKMNPLLDTANTATATVYTPTHIASELQPEWLYLHAHMPPAKWASLPSFGGAASWLGMHHSLRKGQNELDYLNRQFLNHKIDAATYRQRLLQAAFLHYGHLHGHHHLEDDADFPRLRVLEPKLNAGFDLLEHDHVAVAAQTQHIDGLLHELKHATVATPALAERLQQAMQRNGELLYRHLADEEDLVIPVLALNA